MRQRECGRLIWGWRCVVGVDAAPARAVQVAQRGVSPEILVGLKQGQSNFSNASLKGTFTLITYAYNSTGDLGTLLTVTFDGAGNFAGTGAQNLAQTVSSMAVSGTYTVAADSANGNTLVASQTTSGHPPAVLFAVLL